MWRGVWASQRVIEGLRQNTDPWSTDPLLNPLTDPLKNSLETIIKEKYTLRPTYPRKKLFFNTAQCYYGYTTCMSRAIIFTCVISFARSLRDLRTSRHKTKKNSSISPKHLRFWRAKQIDWKGEINYYSYCKHFHWCAEVSCFVYFLAQR